MFLVGKAFSPELATVAESIFFREFPIVFEDFVHHIGVLKPCRLEKIGSEAGANRRLVFFVPITNQSIGR